MSAIPYFNQQTGRFQGYRGNARRPHLHEMTATAGWRDGLYGSDRQRESLRELIHALRTPLNAIRSEEHTSELQSLMRLSYAVFCFKKKNTYYITVTV